MNRVQDLKNHIAAKYPKLSSKNFDIAKIGARIYIYLVDINGNLQREQLFRGALPMVNEVPVLRQQLDLNIKNVMQKWHYC